MFVSYLNLKFLFVEVYFLVLYVYHFFNILYKVILVVFEKLLDVNCIFKLYETVIVILFIMHYIICVGYIWIVHVLHVFCIFRNTFHEVVPECKFLSLKNSSDIYRVVYKLIIESQHHPIYRVGVNEFFGNSFILIIIMFTRLVLV